MRKGVVEKEAGQSRTKPDKMGVVGELRAWTKYARKMRTRKMEMRRKKCNNA